MPPFSGISRVLSYRLADSKMMYFLLIFGTGNQRTVARLKVEVKYYRANGGWRSPFRFIKVLLSKVMQYYRIGVKVLLWLLLSFVVGDIQAQNSSNKGTDFWVGFMAHRNGTSAEMYLYITSDSNTSGTVSIPGQSWSTNFTVTANNMTLVKIPSNTAYVGCSDCIEKRGIHVTSKEKVVVYSHIYHQYCSDATLVLPTPTTGKEYYAMSYEQLQNNARSVFMIVASKDDTKVRITPTVTLQGSSGDRTKGKAYEVTLDAGEIYQGLAKSAGASEDVTGTHIEVIDTGANSNCRTVAVFSGSSDTYLMCSNPSNGLNSRDNLYQQLYPTRSWGTRFITIPFKGRTVDNIRVVAAEDGTQIVINHESGAPTVTYLDAGEMYTIKDVNSTKYILASKPVCVAQYQTTQRCGGKGDPSMTILSPIEQTLKQITVYSSEYEDIDDHYINVIIPTSAANTFSIDGSSATFTKVPKNQSYSYSRISVTKGNHKMSADAGFLAIAYGFGDYESYGYSAGANVKDLTAKINLTNSAQQEKNSICLGQAAKFEGEAEYKVSQWIWDYGDGTRDTAQKVQHIYKDTGDYIVTMYSYKVLFDGCSTYDSTEMEVRVNGTPEADFGMSLLCEKGTVNFTDSSKAPGGENILVRQWKFHDNSTKYAANSSYYYDTSGQFDVWFIVKTEAQCIDTMHKVITINPLPIADFEVDDVCYIDTSKFKDLSSVRTGSIDSYKWYFGDGDSSAVSSPSHFYKDSGSFVAQLIVTTDSGCTALHKDTLLKYPKFTIDFTYKDTCAGLSVDFKNTSVSEGLSLSNFLWKFPGSVEYTTRDVQHQFSNPGTYDVWLIGKQDTVCVDSVMKTVTSDPNITADFTISSNCLVDTITFISKSTVGSGTIDQNIWDLDDGFSAGTDTAKAKYTSKGVKDIRLISISDKGCADTAYKSITLLDPKISSFNLPVICQNNDGNITANIALDGDSVVTWDWFANGSTSSSDTLKFNSSQTGRFEVTLDVVTKNNCALSHVDSVDVWTVPKALFTVDPVCLGADLKPNNQSSIENGENISNYSWYLNNNLASTNENPTIATTKVGMNDVRLIVTSPKGCNDAMLLSVEVYPLPVATFTYSDTCFGEITTFNSTSTVTSGSISSHNWTYNDMNTGSGSTTDRDFPTPGEYSVKLLVVTDKGCEDSLTKSFSIMPLPTMDLTADQTSGCQPFRPEFANNSTIASGVINQFTWDFGDGSARTTGTNPGHLYNTPGMYTVRLIAESNAGCKDSVDLTSQVEVLAKPVAAFSFTPEEPSLLHPEVSLLNESSSDAATFEWTISDGASYTTRDVQHKFPQAGDYVANLIARSANGCSDTTEKQIHVKLDFFLWAPTSFSPNGDRINDEFGISGMVAEVEGYSMAIYNMWGEQIFYSENPVEKWDGTYMGKELETGTFVFIARYKHYETGRWENMSGVVAIIR